MGERVLICIDEGALISIGERGLICMGEKTVQKRTQEKNTVCMFKYMYSTYEKDSGTL